MFTSRKRWVSAFLVIAIIFVCTVPVVAVEVPETEGVPAVSTDSSSLPQVLYVSVDGTEFSAAESQISAANEAQSLVPFEKDHLNFYRTEGDEFGPDFRLALQDDGTLHPLYKVDLPLDEEHPTDILVRKYGYPVSDPMLADVQDQISEQDSGISAITIYTSRQPVNGERGYAPGNFTTVWEGKTVRTEYVESQYHSPDNGREIARTGRNGVSTPTALLDEVEVGFGNVSAARSSSALFTIAKILGKAVVTQIKQAIANGSITEPYVAGQLRSTEVTRYTSVVENGVDCLGCVSNKVYCKYDIFFNSPGVDGENTHSGMIQDEFESPYYQNREALSAAVRNYMNTPVSSLISAIPILVSYPNGGQRTFWEYI